MAVHIRYRLNKTGKTSVYLDIHSGGKRERIRLSDLYLYEKPKDQEQRVHNARVKTLAEMKRSEHQSNLMYESQDIVSPVKQDQIFIDYFKQWQKNYTRHDFRKVDSAVYHFEQFEGNRKIKFKEINENVVNDFKRYLEDRLSGATTKAYFNKFRQVLKRANIDRLCRYDIRSFETRFKLDQNNLKKETLDTDEIQKVASAPCENKDIKLAFIFCCYTGLDFVDVYWLKWSHITETGMSKPRNKTDVGRKTPLHETALAILSLMDRKTEFVFQGLPHRGVTVSKHGKPCDERQYSWSACNATLQALVKRAGIKKHITFHCGRHSYATNLEGDDGTIAQLLGHSNTQMVKVYRRAKQERLRKAVDSLKGVKL